MKFRPVRRSLQDFSLVHCTGKRSTGRWVARKMRGFCSWRENGSVSAMGPHRLPSAHRDVECFQRRPSPNINPDRVTPMTIDALWFSQVVIAALADMAFACALGATLMNAWLSEHSAKD